MAGEISKQEAGDMVASTLEDTTGSSYEVVNVKSTNGVYSVNLQGAQNQLQTVYVTKDGELFSTQMSNLREAQETARMQRKTENCLDSKNVTMYGNLTQRQTQAQIQLMGGTQRVADYYLDVNQQGVLQQAANQGVRSVPAFVFNGQTLEGVNNISDVREFAGCTN